MGTVHVRQGCGWPPARSLLCRLGGCRSNADDDAHVVPQCRNDTTSGILRPSPPGDGFAARTEETLRSAIQGSDGVLCPVGARTASTTLAPAGGSPAA